MYRRPIRSLARPVRRAGNLALNALTALGVVALAIFGFVAFWSSAASANEVREITLPVPFSSVGPANQDGVYWSDTYGACRSGCTRSHLGVDIIGPKMTPLLAANDGYISWMRHDDGRGNNLVITDDDGWQYHYVHINNDTPGTDDGANPFEFAFPPGMERGARVQAGQVVAYMGDSGNAEATVSHLHFEISKPDGSNVNPTFSVDAALARGETQKIELPAEVLAPYDSLDAFADDLYGTLVGRPATSAEADRLADVLLTEGMAAGVAPFVGNNEQGADIDRLYVAYFNRLPDLKGYRYWIDQRAAGWSLARISQFFSESPEYQERYGDAPFSEFLDLLYSDVLGRTPDEGGKAFWLEKLENDPVVTRSTIVSFFTDGPELRGRTEYRSEVVALTALFNDRMPSDAEIDAWIEMRSSADISAAIQATFSVGAG